MRTFKIYSLSSFQVHIQYYFYYYYYFFNGIFFLFIYLFVCLFIFGCIGSSLLRAGFL